MSLGTIILIILILMLVGAFPTRGPTAPSWGYFPSGALGTVLIVVLILVLLGRI